MSRRAQRAQRGELLLDVLVEAHVAHLYSASATMDELGGGPAGISPQGAGIVLTYLERAARVTGVLPGAERHLRAVLHVQEAKCRDRLAALVQPGTVARHAAA